VKIETNASSIWTIIQNIGFLTVRKYLITYGLIMILDFNNLFFEGKSKSKHLI
jgi:hypothetical protein